MFARWVLLKNVHLAPHWLVQLEKKLHSLQPHANFRLFLTMEINPKLPVNLLRAGRIFVVEPPPGIRANLLRTFSTVLLPSVTLLGLGDLENIPRDIEVGIRKEGEEMIIMCAIQRGGQVLTPGGEDYKLAVFPLPAATCARLAFSVGTPWHIPSHIYPSQVDNWMGVLKIFTSDLYKVHR